MFGAAKVIVGLMAIATPGLVRHSLHEFASRIGCRRSWFQDRPGFPHYDLTPEHRDVALHAGAVDIKLRDLIRMMRRNASGSS